MIDANKAMENVAVGDVVAFGSRKAGGLEGMVTVVQKCEGGKFLIMTLDLERAKKLARIVGKVVVFFEGGIN